MTEHASRMNPESFRGTHHATRGALVSRLLKWFSQDARDLPWRRTRDPYAIWVSEIMLQQTQVKTVIPYWERWMGEFPTIQSVAKASPAKLHKLWEGLGYYTRVRNLQRAAQQISAQRDGKFPQNFEDILALSGIGRYTAGAICSIAFNQPKPILDGNVIRVLTRIFNITTDPREKKTNAQLWQLAAELVTHAKDAKTAKSPKEKPLRPLRPWREDNSCSFLNQSLMELGALICTPRTPKCAICPVTKLCIARRENRAEELPNLGKRPAAIARRFLAFVVERDGKFLVRQRPAGVVNAHLWEFPNVEISLGAPSSGRQFPTSKHARNASESQVLPGFQITSPRPLCTIKHSITRYHITLEAWCAELTSSKGATSVFDPARNGKLARNSPSLSPALYGQWFTLRQLHRLAFTSAHKKLLVRSGAPSTDSARNKGHR